MKEFNFVEIQHVPCKHNTQADVLPKLASTRTKSGNKSMIQEVLTKMSVMRNKDVMDIDNICDNLD